ncbi:MAG: DUF5657 family protein [Patescibacteria group bacterium]|nr:DUF5657 family protein [Patescibacteria group bacterium]
MSIFTNPTTESLNNFVVSIFKNCFVIGSVVSLIFAVVVIRQIATMKRTIKTSFSPVVQILGYLHLAISILVFFLFLLWL